MRIGVVGEYPTDIFSICLLLTQKHSFDFFPLLKRVHGSQLDQNENTALKNQLRREFQFEKPNIVLFVRDLDAVTSSANYKKNIRSRRAFFSAFNKVVAKKGIFLVNIYELEALILADLETFNARYQTNLKISDTPEKIQDPKGWLVRETKGKYNQSHNTSLFKELSIETISNNCDYFRQFLTKFERRIKSLKSKTS